MKKLTLMSAALVLAAVPALAQTAAPSSGTMNNNSMKNETAPAPAEKMAPPASSTMTNDKASTTGNANAAVKFTTVKGEEKFTSKLRGLNVYNQSNESIGEISDVAINSSNEVDALILSVGGFLGIGDRYVAVEPSSVQITYDAKNKAWRATMNTTKDQLKSAPEFKYPDTSKM